MKFCISHVFMLTILFIPLDACKQRSQSSTPQQIYREPGDTEGGDITRRFPATSLDAPYVFVVGNYCTGFLLDEKRGIAITANHCSPKVGEVLCFGSPQLGVGPDCKYPGKVAEILETSTSYKFDYMVLQTTWTNGLPPHAKGIRVAGTDRIATLISMKSQLELVGYPADKYAKGKLTRSNCHAKADISMNVHPTIKLIVETWRSDPRYYERSDFNSMREACYFYSTERPTFRADCSVYGGNSGGPLIDVESQVVIGLPVTYYPETVAMSACDKLYWKDYLYPILHPNDTEKKFEQPPAPVNYRAKTWDNLDRNSSPVSDTPKFIPFSSIVESSRFFAKHPELISK